MQSNKKLGSILLEVVTMLMLQRGVHLSSAPPEKQIGNTCDNIYIKIFQKIVHTQVVQKKEEGS